MPEPIRGVPLLTIDAACIGDQASGEATIAPLREIGETIMDTFEQMPAAGLSRIHMDPENPVPGIGDGVTIARAARRGDRRLHRPSPARTPARRCCSASCATSAAPLGRPAENGGALSHLDAGFAMYSVGMPMTPELGEAIRGHLGQIEETMAPWAADGGYFNFTERPCDVDAILPPTSAPGSPRSSAATTPTARSSPTTPCP